MNTVRELLGETVRFCSTAGSGKRLSRQEYVRSVRGSCSGEETRGNVHRFRIAVRAPVSATRERI